jgi:phage terminase small subunit
MLSDTVKPPRKPKLTVKQSLFINEYLLDFNQTRAAIAAGYSRNTAAVIASENLQKPYIKSEIDRRLALVVDKGVDKIAWVLRELISVAQDNSIMTRSSKVKALELLGKYYSMWTERTEIRVETNAPLQITFEEISSQPEDN